MSRRVLAAWLARTVVAALVAATGALGLAGPAAAALCSGGSGVSVVVDYRSLGGGVVTGCGSGSTAAAITQAAGVSLTQASREPGFVCRVNGKPASDPCVNASPANAYWGLYWSNGNGSWTYANLGAYSLKVPNGGFVGWSFQNGGANQAPGLTPRTPSAPKPTKPAKPSKPAKPAPPKTAAPQPSTTAAPQQSSAPSAGSGGSEGTAGAAPSAAASRSAKAAASKSPSKAAKPGAASKAASASASASPTASAESEASADAEAGIEPASSQVGGDDGGGLPLWVPVGVLALLAAGGGGVVWWRRRAG